MGNIAFFRRDLDLYQLPLRVGTHQDNTYPITLFSFRKKNVFFFAYGFQKKQ